MRAVYIIQRGRKNWHILPFPAVKCAGISVVLVVASLFVLDRIVLPNLERQGLTSGENWSRHNSVVIHEHELSDKTIAFPEPTPPLVPAGVREWVGQRVSFEKTPGKSRILVMGDSFVWGSAYLSLNHMWWRQLGQILEKESAEVIAIGRPGASTRDQLEWAKYFVPKYQPDLIIWGYVTNDADEGLIRQISMSQQSIPKLNRVRNVAKVIWPRLFAKFDALRSHKLATMYTGPEYGYEYSEWELMLVTPDNLAAYSKTIHDVKTFLSDTNVRSFMMTLPNYPSTARFNPRFEPILRVWNKEGIPAYDVTPEFVRRYGEMQESGSETIRWGINPADGHPGPRACRFLAEQAVEILRRDFSDILGEKSESPPRPVINDWLPSLDPSSTVVVTKSDRAGFEMVCPADESRFPTMPLEIPTPLIAMEIPVPLTAIEVAGPSLKSARLWVTFLDPVEHYDDGVVHDLGETHGEKLTWHLPAELASRPVSVIRLRTTFSTSDRRLVWSFRTESAVGQ